MRQIIARIFSVVRNGSRGKVCILCMCLLLSLMFQGCVLEVEKQALLPGAPRLCICLVSLYPHLYIGILLKIFINDGGQE